MIIRSKYGNLNKVDWVGLFLDMKDLLGRFSLIRKEIILLLEVMINLLWYGIAILIGILAMLVEVSKIILKKKSMGMVYSLCSKAIK